MVRVRIAPSPTGFLHVGTARTALYNFLFAKNQGGKFIIRVEDTDKERSTIESEKDILDGLEMLGFVADESPRNPGAYGPYRQSERTEIYKKYLYELLEAGHAYYCFCTSEELDAGRKVAEEQKVPFRYSGKCRNCSLEESKKRIENGEKYVIRMKVPDQREVRFHDEVKGDMKQDMKDVSGDMVIAKDLETPLYNFCVVIDDHLMEITHVIRGEDHLTNTFKQLLVYEVFGWDIPKFVHLPLILNPDRTKLSKRKTKASVVDYLNDGYLKEALLNFIVLIGWNDGTTQEIFSIEELISKFTLDRVQKSGGIWDFQRLDWFNSQYIRAMSDETLAEMALPYLEEAGHIQRELVSEEFVCHSLITQEKFTLIDIAQMVHYEKERITQVKELGAYLDFYFVETLEYAPELLVGKSDVATVRVVLEKLLELFEKTEDFSEEALKTLLIAKIAEWNLKNGEVLWPLRVALTGRDKSPGAFEVASVLGKVKVIYRLEEALKKVR